MINTEKQKQELNISGLEQGVVIDHIKAGGALKIYSYLDLENKDVSVAIIKNAKSNKMGKKDIIKIEGTMEDLNLDILGALDHRITINIIEDGKIVGKKNPTLPEHVSNILKCKNPRCITSIEPGLIHSFKLTDRANGVYRCIYCEQAFDRR
jgi:aspartate carbamoyltransferase regulatory subunit